MTLRDLRERRGMSQATLSKASGVAASTICHLETGKRQSPHLRTVNALATALDESASSVAAAILASAAR